MAYSSFLEKFGLWFHIFLKLYEFSKFKSFSEKEKKWIILVLTRGGFRLGKADPVADRWGQVNGQR